MQQGRGNIDDKTFFKNGGITFVEAPQKQQKKERNSYGKGKLPLGYERE